MEGGQAHSSIRCEAKRGAQKRPNPGSQPLLGLRPAQGPPSPTGGQTPPPPPPPGSGTRRGGAGAAPTGRGEEAVDEEQEFRKQELTAQGAVSTRRVRIQRRERSHGDEPLPWERVGGPGLRGGAEAEEGGDQGTPVLTPGQS